MAKLALRGGSGRIWPVAEWQHLVMIFKCLAFADRSANTNTSPHFRYLGVDVQVPENRGC
jgi:hypothetical protein